MNKRRWVMAAAAVFMAAAFSRGAGGQDSAGDDASEKEPLPRVLLSTSQGDVLIELFEDEAPNTVANFIHLVEKEFYDGVPFHRVIADFMAQTGCPRGDGTGGPGWTIKCECYQENARKHEGPGVVAMAHAGRDTGGSQFYITYRATPHLDGPDYFHTVFGRVVEGMEAIEELAEIPRGGRPAVIKKARVVRKRDHEYQPEVTRDER